MTDKEKAKAYDEALERAREAYKSTKNDALKRLIENTFPELRESEDERIRKELIAVIDEGRVFDIDKEVADRWIAYLEKQKESLGDFIDDFPYSDVQKEQKPTINIDQLKSLMLQYLQEAANEKDDSDIEADTDKWARKILGYDFEQKPIKWTDLTWKDIIELEGIINKVHYEFRNGIGQESFGKEVLEKFREYKGDEYLDEKEQKLTEWSEDDEKIANEILDHFNTENAEWFNWFNARFKSLRPQGSKDSLQTHWKPSEEQMEALQNAVALAAGNKVLAGLYEHLLKSYRI